MAKMVTLKSDGKNGDKLAAYVYQAEVLEMITHASVELQS